MSGVFPASGGPLPLGEREAELRQRNADVDRRRAEALRLATDVVRHQEVCMSPRVVPAREKLRGEAGISRTPRPVAAFP
jgi:hypothetical protein